MINLIRRKWCYMLTFIVSLIIFTAYIKNPNHLNLNPNKRTIHYIDPKLAFRKFTQPENFRNLSKESVHSRMGFKDQDIINNQIPLHLFPDMSNEYYVWERKELEQRGLWNYREINLSGLKRISVLGRRLFLHENVGQQSVQKFLIHIHQSGPFLERRLIRHFSKEYHNPFEKCSVDNCELSYENKDFHKADAILFHLHQLKHPMKHFERKNFEQRWVWMSDESPFNTFLMAKDKIYSHYDGYFNWSMTYRISSDVPVPYGRTVPRLDGTLLNPDHLDVYSRKNRIVAILGSNCSGKNNRWKYVKYLRKHINVDTYGKCGELKCGAHNYGTDCPLLQMYMFYLAFENSNCQEYITEKSWWNAFEKEAVPIVMGASKEEYKMLFPPNSFIYAEDFKTPKELADYLLYLVENKTDYNKYHSWRRDFKVLNEHGYFKTDVYHYCRLCEALNYNSKSPKTYTHFEDFWKVAKDCYPIRWKASV